MPRNKRFFGKCGSSHCCVCLANRQYKYVKAEAGAIDRLENVDEDMEADSISEKDKENS